MHVDCMPGRQVIDTMKYNNTLQLCQTTQDACASCALGLLKLIMCYCYCALIGPSIALMLHCDLQPSDSPQTTKHARVQVTHSAYAGAACSAELKEASQA